MSSNLREIPLLRKKKEFVELEKIFLDAHVLKLSGFKSNYDQVLLFKISQER